MDWIERLEMVQGTDDILVHGFYTVSLHTVFLITHYLPYLKRVHQNLIIALYVIISFCYKYQQ